MIYLAKVFGPKILMAVMFVMLIFAGLSFLQHRAEEQFLRDRKIDSIEQEIVIRKRVDDILEENREANPTRDGDIALDRLFQQYRTETD